MYIKTCGGELQDQEKAACVHTHLQAYTTATVSYLCQQQLKNYEML